MLSMFDTGSFLVQILPLNAIKSKLYINYREAAWYTCTANHICSLQRLCRLKAHVKTSLSADDRTKAQIESAKARLRIHSTQDPATSKSDVDSYTLI